MGRFLCSLKLEGRGSEIDDDRYNRRSFLKWSAAAGVGGALASARVAGAQETESETPVLKGELVVNVKDYGALGDGAADDTSAIQSALDDASSRGGGTVLIPAGTYSTSKTIRIPGGVALIGSGVSSSVLRARDGSMNPLLETGGDDGLVSDLKLDGNDANADDTDAIVILHSFWKVIHCEVTAWGNWAVAVYTNSPGGSYRSPSAVSASLKDIEIVGNRFVGRSGVMSTPSNQGGVYVGVDVTNFTISRNYLQASEGSPETGAFSGIRADTCSHGSVIGNRFLCAGRTFDGIVAWGATDLTIAGNVVDGPHDDGITYRDNLDGSRHAERIVIADNVLLNCGTSGVLSPHGNHSAITIVGNVVRGTVLAGIRFAGAKNSSCIGNTIQRAGHYGIDVLPSGGGGPHKTLDSVVADNTIDTPSWSGIHIAPGNDRNIVKGNTIRNSGSGPGAVNANGIYVEGSDCLVQGNMVSASLGNGVLLTNQASRSTISGNRVIDSELNGVYLPPGTNDCLVEGNHVTGSKEMGVLVYGAGARNCMTSNRIVGNGRAGIKAISQTDMMVTGNMVMNNGTRPGGDKQGLRLYNCVRAVVSGNKFGDDQSVPTQLPHIREDGASSNNLIVGNGLTPGTGGVSRIGTNSRLAHNLGDGTHNT